jgi:polar amino acid transport system substrate-binding protein
VGDIFEGDPSMRRTILIGVLVALTAAACGGSSGATQPSPSASAASCATSSLHLLHPGTLTIGVDNPAYQPWFAGAKGSGQGPWKADPSNGTGNPYSGKGYEAEVAYGIADDLGFSHDEVQWVAVPFNNSYKPGGKDFDLYIDQVSYSPERAKAVDFSTGYYDVQQALVANKGTPTASAKSFADLKDKQLGVQIGTTSYAYIINNIKPDKQPTVYDNSTDVIAALNAGQIDGYLVDAPDAYVNVLVGEAKNGVVVGQFPTIGNQEFYGVILEKGNPLVSCVDKAISTLKSNGTLDALQQKYLKAITFPVITQ